MSSDFPVSKVVLVVDDLDSLRKMLCDFLESLGLEVLRASSATEAIQVASSHVGNIHLLLTDLDMPGMTGWELATKIDSLKPGIRILYMSGGISVGDWESHEQRVAGTYFIEKPFKLGELRILLLKAIFPE